MTKKICSFCGRSEKDVKLLISGLSGYICDNCVQQAYEILTTSGVLGETGQAGEEQEQFDLKNCRSPAKLSNILMNTSSDKTMPSAIWPWLSTTITSDFSNRRVTKVWR